MILKWAILLVLVVNDQPTLRNTLVLDPAEVKTEAECLAVVKELTAEAIKNEMDVIARCVDIETQARIKKGKPNDKKSEVTS